MVPSPGRCSPATRSTPPSVGSLRRRIVSAFAAVGVKMVPHQLRHSYGTAIARATEGDMMTVMALMGHASLDTSRGYVRWSNHGHAEVVARLYVDDPPSEQCHGDLGPTAPIRGRQRA